jgi:spore coat polysaccharide biosynthesis protein SpsF (cytidylyltransferase family)
VVAIVQARMGSTRLPGKVLADLDGEPLLAHVLRRAGAAASVDEVVLATTREPRDDALLSVAEAADVRIVRGSEDDVLGRYTVAADAALADIVVRITGDCPLLDPAVVDTVVESLEKSSADYASNILQRTFPKGLDVEALHHDVLTRVARLASSVAAREHVTWFIREERPDLFVRRSVTTEDGDWSELNWSVDSSEDLERVRALLRAHGGAVPWRSLVDG